MKFQVNFPACPKCGKAKERRAKTCRDCATKGSGVPKDFHTVICEHCKEKFEIPLWRLKQNRGKFCSRLCANQFLIGKKQSKETIEKRVKQFRGEQNWNWKDGKSKRDYRKVVKKEQCENCQTKLNLGIHHRNLDHYDNRLKNLQVLCNSCHLKLHQALYRKAKKEGKPKPISNAPIGWKSKRKEGATR
jgi:hypothetical protein